MFTARLLLVNISHLFILVNDQFITWERLFSLWDQILIKELVKFLLSPNIVLNDLPLL